MNNNFDELTKGLAQSVTRRAALKQFGVGLAGVALACFGLANKARAATYTGYCEAARNPYYGAVSKNKWLLTGHCIGVDRATGTCLAMPSSGCTANEPVGQGRTGPCGYGWHWKTSLPCSFSF